MSYMLNNSWSYKTDYLICYFISLLFVEVEPINDDIYAPTPDDYFDNQQLGTSKYDSIYKFLDKRYTCLKFYVFYLCLILLYANK